MRLPWIWDAEGFRNRVAFALGIQPMGGAAVQVPGRLDDKEPFEDVARYSDNLLDAIVRARDHRYVERLAERLKYFFNETVIRAIARDIRSQHPPFDETSFVAMCMEGLEDLELTERAGRVAEAMRRYLPNDFAVAARIIADSLGPELEGSDTFGLEPLRYMPHVFFVARYGLDDFEVSMWLQHELTRRFSAEGSIRAFLVTYPERTYARLQQWATDPNVHVRRLVSEGTRPRLPWARRLRAYQEDPAPVIRLLEMLKDDPHRYVQRSVANSLNDISKDHPDIAVDVCRRWSAGAGDGREWTVRHALRSLVKEGHRGALEVLGYASAPEIKITAVRFEPEHVKLGSTMRFSFDLCSEGDRDQGLLVDYAVHFVKANGARTPKVFKLRELVLPPGGRVRLDGRVSFADMTTRKHRPGRHQVDVLVNGVRYTLGEFEVSR